MNIAKGFDMTIRAETVSTASVSSSFCLKHTKATSYRRTYLTIIFTEYSIQISENPAILALRICICHP